MSTDLVPETEYVDLPVHVAEPPSLFRTDDPVEVVTKATTVANALADVIQRKQLFVKVSGKSHVLVEGWQLLGSMLGVTAVCVHTEPVENGYKATVEARTADGRVVGRADALCTSVEKRGPWKDADDYARLSMAQTRATSKALKGPLGFIVSLAGYETTPAEEMTFAEQQRGGSSADTSDRVEPSKAQVDLIVRMAKKGGADASDQENIRAYVTEKLTGGKNGSCSKVIDKLQGDDPNILVELAKAADEWTKRAAADVKADDPSEPEPTEAEMEQVPFS